MIKKKFEIVNQHIKSQFKKVHELIKNKTEEDKLYEEHFWDLENKDFIPKHYTDFSKKPFAEITDERERVVYGCIKFKLLTAAGLSRCLKLSKVRVWEIYKKASNRVSLCENPSPVK